MVNKFSHIFIELYPLVAAVVSMTVAQVIKSVHSYLVSNKLDMRKVMTSGGMPSSHSAMVTALTVAIGLREGWLSSLFSISVVFSLIVLYDAAGVRRAVGKQGEILNQIMDDVLKGEFKAQKVTQLLGHTPLEVIAGALLGAGIAFTLYY
jgi:uncharacterized protein